MRETVKLGEDLVNAMVQETEMMLAERSAMRDILETRGGELEARRDEELRRIDRWAEAQKAVVGEVFAAMISENEIDKQKHEGAIKRLLGDNPMPAPAAAPKKPTVKLRLHAAAE
jgi:hypothetical protein